MQRRIHVIGWSGAPLTDQVSPFALHVNAEEMGAVQAGPHQSARAAAMVIMRRAALVITAERSSSSIEGRLIPFGESLGLAQIGTVSGS